MEFPAYVPAAVRAHISHYLEGEHERDIRGYIELHTNAKRGVADAERAISAYVSKWEDFDLAGDPYLDRLRMRLVEAEKHRDMLAGYVGCLQRLAHDTRMQDAFELLSCEFTTDKQWRNFIHSAWSARVNFEEYRDRMRRATELKGDIADAADTLAKLFRQFSETGMSRPDEFYSVPELLRQTDNHDMQGNNLHMWRAMRHYVLGDLPKRDIPEAKPAENGGEPMRRAEIPHSGDDYQGNETRDTLRYAWGIAPDLSELLDTVAKAARNFQPSGSGMVGAAIKSRQRSRAENKEYLRAFGNLLTETHGLSLTLNIMKAMAIAATVVIDYPNIVVTYDDVTKAIGKPIETRA